MNDSAASVVRPIIDSPAFRAARATLEAEHERTVQDIITLTEIPAPSFQEQQRAQAFLEMARAHGLQDLEIDAEGNVTGIRRGIGNGRLICVAAHLDTVFPPGTPIKVRREGNKLFAPGIGDDTRSLAVLLAWLRALDAAAIRTRADILFVADVGEEGPGDLRGMRHLFQRGPYKDRISAFITVDSPNMEHIATGGVGSKRYRVTFTGPGGHSYGAFGLVNPMYAMADAITRLGRIPVPTRPKTTYSASVTGGGTSINSIPNSVWTEFDLRSESPHELDRLEQAFLLLVREAVTAENAARSIQRGAISADLTKIGDRPAGHTDEAGELPSLAKAALAAHGFKASFETSSTDANIPLSLGIPAIKIGSGGTGGRAHSLEEWIDVTPEHSVRGMAAGLATLLAVAGMG
ncbi:MAG TPA: M20/M25/M40 family metallo-hydrolase [Acetobacteraceae bacterium]|nr:M20/M25/M40 family metallo-hydrolase [Acetobacteraceae bacterium]